MRTGRFGKSESNSLRSNATASLCAVKGMEGGGALKRLTICEIPLSDERVPRQPHESFFLTVLGMPSKLRLKRVRTAESPFAT